MNEMTQMKTIRFLCNLRVKSSCCWAIYIKIYELNVVELSLKLDKYLIQYFILDTFHLWNDKIFTFLFYKFQWYNMIHYLLLKIKNLYNQKNHTSMWIFFFLVWRIWVFFFSITKWCQLFSLHHHLVCTFSSSIGFLYLPKGSSTVDLIIDWNIITLPFHPVSSTLNVSVIRFCITNGFYSEKHFGIYSSRITSYLPF